MSAGKGFTLIGLMIGIAIISILATTTIPNLSIFITKLHVSAQASSLQRLLLLARNNAINYDQVVTVCPLDNSLNCTNQWQNELTVFIDHNADKHLSYAEHDRILATKSALSDDDRLLFAKGRKAVKYAATGRLHGWGSNGTFRYCPKHHVELAKGIIIAVSGRVYLTTDTDHDGVDENRHNSELSCTQ